MYERKEGGRDLQLLISFRSTILVKNSNRKDVDNQKDDINDNKKTWDIAARKSIESTCAHDDEKQDDIAIPHK